MWREAGGAQRGGRGPDEAAHVATLTGAGLPAQLAAALAEMFACLASGRVSPRGDRTERGTTSLDDVLRDALAHARAR